MSLGSQERALLAGLPTQMLDVLADPGSPSLRRLFPPAYSSPQHVEYQEEYRRLMNDDLLERHRDSLTMLQATAGATELTTEQLDAWMRAINSVRLLLGTHLDVSEDDEPVGDPSPELSVYHYLGYLQECVVEALSADWPGEDGDDGPRQGP